MPCIELFVGSLPLNKLRKYVMYTWGCELLEDEGKVTTKQLSRRSMRTDSLCGIGSLHKRKQLNRTDSISFEKKNNVGVEMVSAYPNILDIFFFLEIVNGAS